MTDDFLDRYSGKKPPDPGFNIALSSHVLMMIGHIVAQWAALCVIIKFKVSFARGSPDVPENLRKIHVRSETKYQIDYLRKTGPHVYANTRPKAAREFDAIMGTIGRLKGDRDALVHGTFAIADNKDPNAITVQYKRKKITFSPDDLTRIAHEIGRMSGFLMEFDTWANYEMYRSLLEKLDEQARSAKTNHTLDKP